MGLGGSRDFELPLDSEAPRDTSDFELVTWLVITTRIIERSGFGKSLLHTVRAK